VGQYFMLINEDRKEFVCPHCAGGLAKLFEWCANPQAGLLPYLLRRSTQTGGGDIQDVSSEFAGRWAGQRVCLVGDYDASGLYKKAQEEFTNITPGLCREYNQFMDSPELRLSDALCSTCGQRAREPEQGERG